MSSPPIVDKGRRVNSHLDRPPQPAATRRLAGPALERLLLHARSTKSRDDPEVCPRHSDGPTGASRVFTGLPRPRARRRASVPRPWRLVRPDSRGRARRPLRLRPRAAHQRPRPLARGSELPEHGVQLAGAGLGDRRRKPPQQPSRTPARAEVQRAMVRVRSFVAGDPRVGRSQAGRDHRRVGQVFGHLNPQALRDVKARSPTPTRGSYQNGADAAPTGHVAQPSVRRSRHPASTRLLSGSSQSSPYPPPFMTIPAGQPAIIPTRTDARNISKCMTRPP